MTDAGRVKNDWIHRYYPITDGPCAGQSIRSHAKTRHYELLNQVPRHTVWEPAVTVLAIPAEPARGTTVRALGGPRAGGYRTRVSGKHYDRWLSWTVATSYPSWFEVLIEAGPEGVEVVDGVAPPWRTGGPPYRHANGLHCYGCQICLDDGERRAWMDGDPEPLNAPPDQPLPQLVVDRYGLHWVPDERYDGFEGWRCASHGLTLWRTWGQLTAERAPLREAA